MENDKDSDTTSKNNTTFREERTDNKCEPKGMNRRGFLKKLGAGSIGLGVLSMSPVSALDLRSTNFEFFNSSTSTAPNVEINDQGKLVLNNAIVDSAGNEVEEFAGPGLDITNGVLEASGSDSGGLSYGGLITSSQTISQANSIYVWGGSGNIDLTLDSSMNNDGNFVILVGT